jgi:cobalt-zinc-cadmium resistance protein CzcA
MINQLIQLAIRQRVLVLIAAIVMLAWGAFSFTQLPIEAYPDVMNTEVVVITQWPGHAAEEVEKQVTIPLEISLYAVPHISSLRSRSLFGLSAVYLTFDDDVDDYFARDQVNQALTGVSLPNGLQPSMQPMESAAGEIMRYVVVGNVPLSKLKEIQDWTLYREFHSVPGVADVAIFGGTTKEYQVQLDRRKMDNYGVTTAQVEQAITNSNANGGGNYIFRGSETVVVRGIGLLKGSADISNVVVAEHNGAPVLVKDIGIVRVGFLPRLGKIGMKLGNGGPDLDDVAMATIVMRRYENATDVLNGVHAKIKELNDEVLPKGVKVIPFIDRTDLIAVTTHTVEHNLLDGVVLVVFVLFLFLGNVRAAVIVAITIPFSLLFAFSIMNVIHVPANLISLGAIDFGVIVNGSVILVENIYRHLALRNPRESILSSILAATREVEADIVFTTLIIILAYLPLFTMQSVEKKMFSPMAYTIGLALVGSLIMAMAVAPVLCYLMLRGKIVDRESRVFVALRNGYRRALDRALRYPLVTLSLGAAVFAVGMLVLPALGTEFLPHLDEGNIYMRASLPPTISYQESARIVPRIRAVLASFQPVDLVQSQIGRPDDAEDVTGYDNSEYLVNLKPYDQWKGYAAKDDLVNAMNAKLSQIPGVSFNFSQNIEDNVEEAITGVKGELAVKLFGDDLDTLESKANEISHVMNKVPGIVDLTVFTETGQPQLQVVVDRAKCARYGLNVSDVQDVVQTQIGGQEFTTLLDGEKQFGVRVSMQHDLTNNINKVRNLMVDTPDGYRIPLSMVADVHNAVGASFIYRESGRRYIAIKFGVRGRDIGGAVQEAQAAVAKQVSLPAGYHVVFGGEFESMQRAGHRLAIILPVTIGLIFMVLFMLFGNVSRPAMVLTNVPVSLAGSIFLLYVMGFHLSVSAAVGFIALFGVAVQNGVIMVSYIDQMCLRGASVRDAVLNGAAIRLRPVLMTAMLATIGLVPAAISKGIGSDVQKPLAVAIIGGLILDVSVGTLFVLPVLYSLVARRHPASAPAAPEPVYPH